MSVYIVRPRRGTHRRTGPATRLGLWLRLYWSGY